MDGKVKLSEVRNEIVVIISLLAKMMLVMFYQVSQSLFLIKDFQRIAFGYRSPRPPSPSNLMSQLQRKHRE